MTKLTAVTAALAVVLLGLVAGEAGAGPIPGIAAYGSPGACVGDGAPCLQPVNQSDEDGTSASQDSYQGGIEQTFLLLRYGMNEDALAAARDLRADWPDRAVPVQLEGLALWQLGRHGEAIDALRRAHALDPEDAGIVHNLMRFYRLQGRSEVGLDVVQDIVPKFPGNLELQLEYTSLLEQAGRQQELETRLRELVAAHPDEAAPKIHLARALTLGGQPDEALAILDGLSPAEQAMPAVLDVRGRALQAQGDPQAAAAVFEKLAAQAPDLPDAHLYAGQARLQAEQPDRAIPHLKRAWELRPGEVSIATALAEAYVRDRQPTLAGDLIDQLQADFPDDPRVHLLRGRYELAVNSDSEAAQAALKRAQDLAGDADNVAAIATLRVRSGDVAGATADLEAWLAKHPDSAAPMRVLAELHLAGGRYTDAAELYRRLLADDPGNAVYRNNLAWSLEQTGAHAEALEHAEKAVAAAPDSPDALDTYGTVLLSLGEADKAVEALQKAAELSQQRPDIVLNLAVALKSAGDVEAARGVLAGLDSDSFSASQMALYKMVTESSN